MRRAAGMALVAGGTLLAEVALTRVLSVSLYHHFAFLVVSTALLGTGIAGATLSASRRLSELKPEDLAAFGALTLGLGLPVCFTLVQFVGLEPLALASGGGATVRLGVVYILFAVPFFGGGMAIAAILSGHVNDAPRMYAADLVGASGGAFLALGAMGWFGGIGAVIFGAALGAAGAVAFGRGPFRVTSAAVTVGLLVLAPFADAVLPLHITASKVTRSGRAFSELLADRSKVRSTAYNTMARVDHVVLRPGLERLMIDAGVAAVRIPDARPPRASDATLPYELRPGAEVLIVGAGAGWEVEEALAFGAKHVDAVEVNPLIAAHVPPAIADNERVRWIVDEGRSFVERTGKRYDAIVMIHTISNAATSAGAMHLAEDYLLTKEALDVLLSRLTDDGWLFLTRPESQLPRLLGTLPSNVHVFAWAEKSVRSSFYGALLISRRAPTDSDAQKIVARIAERTGLRMLFTPTTPATDPLLAGLRRGDDLDSLEAIAESRLDPATDDRPFFHQRRRFTELSLEDLSRTLGDDTNARMALEDRPFTEIAALLLLIETTLIGSAALLLPLWWSRRRGVRVVGQRRAATFVYFGALGLAFMLIEIALVQRLGLLLGAPALAFATVFGGLLLGAGAGSHFSARLQRPARTPAYAAAAGLLLALLSPIVIGFGAPQAEAIRIALALALVLPTGFVLGMPFPAGLVRLGRSSDGLVAWAFATNGIASISGTVLAVIGASIVGFTAVMGVGAALYGLAYVAGRRL